MHGFTNAKFIFIPRNMHIFHIAKFLLILSLVLKLKISLRFVFLTEMCNCLQAAN